MDPQRKRSTNGRTSSPNSKFKQIPRYSQDAKNVKPTVQKDLYDDSEMEQFYQEAISGK